MDLLDQILVHQLVPPGVFVLDFANKPGLRQMIQRSQDDVATRLCPPRNFLQRQRNARILLRNQAPQQQAGRLWMS